MSERGWELQRLNQDACWWLRLGAGAVVFDPWLIGGEVDLARWFSEQWHTGPVAALHEVPAHQVVVISQSWADHCHAETLARWPEGPALLVVPDAIAAVRAACPGRAVIEIPAWPSEVEVAGLRFCRVSRPWWHPPRYHAVRVRDAAGRSALHAPHGLPAALGAALADEHPIALVATSRRSFVLPWWLGGRVNPGPEAADALVRACRAPAAIAVHDEDKRSAGLVTRLAQVGRAHGAGDAAVWRLLVGLERLRLHDEPAAPRG